MKLYGDSRSDFLYFYSKIHRGFNFGGYSLDEGGKVSLGAIFPQDKESTTGLTITTVQADCRGECAMIFTDLTIRSDGYGTI
jgi:hypothetical protein